MKKAPSVTGLFSLSKKVFRQAAAEGQPYGSNRPIIAMPATVMAMAA